MGYSDGIIRGVVMPIYPGHLREVNDILKSLVILQHDFKIQTSNTLFKFIRDITQVDQLTLVSIREYKTIEPSYQEYKRSNVERDKLVRTFKSIKVQLKEDVFAVLICRNLLSGSDYIFYSLSFRDSNDNLIMPAPNVPSCFSKRAGSIALGSTFDARYLNGNEQVIHYPVNGNTWYYTEPLEASIQLVLREDKKTQDVLNELTDAGYFDPSLDDDTKSFIWCMVVA